MQFAWDCAFVGFWFAAGMVIFGVIPIALIIILSRVIATWEYKRGLRKS